MVLLMLLSFQPAKERPWDKPSSRKPSLVSPKAPLQPGSRVLQHRGRGPGEDLCHLPTPSASARLLQGEEGRCRPAWIISNAEVLSQTGLLAKQDIPVVLFVCSLLLDASEPRDGKSDTESMENMSLDGYRPGPGGVGGR